MQLDHKDYLTPIFEGDWQIERISNGDPFFKGNGCFTPMNDDLLHYHEEGQVCYPNGFKTTSFRDYYFQLELGSFSVYFDEACQNLFHTIRLEKSDGKFIGSAQHLCIKDLYDTSYVFNNQKSWEWQHKVKGPKKDYYLFSRYYRE